MAKEEINFLLYLWWPNGNISAELAEYRMFVHIFGAVSLPSCATFSLLKTGDDNQKDYSDYAEKASTAAT